uniref:histidine kinase n=1 Tax=Thermosporothrix sp. COM3 TaxID=2490863 RepID=A0A455SHC1_9CHLR|nr:two-component sensor histidine kinase [Thermosporothrix sp. COM3]
MMRIWHMFRNWLASLSLRWRLTLVVLGLMTALLGGAGLLLSLVTEQALLNNTASSLRREVILTAKGVPGRSFTLSWAPEERKGELPRGFDASVAILRQRLTSLGVNMTILRPDGSVLYPGQATSLAPPPIVLGQSDVTRLLEDGLQGDAYKLGKTAQGQRQLVILVPLVSAERTVALLQVGTPIASIDDFLTTFHILLLVCYLGALCCALVLLFPLVDATLRPLLEMERKSRRIAAGELSLRIDTPKSRDEIGRLAHSFNQMVVQLENAFQRQKQFVSDVSHELRTPLTALSGSLEMLLIGADRGDIGATRRLAKGMYVEVQRMHRLVEDLLSLTRLDAKKLKLRLEAFELQTVFSRIFQQAQQLATGHEIRCSIAPDTPQVYADRDRLQQVLLNIVDNALKFTPSDGQVELTAASGKQGEVVIAVRDTGQGIPAEALPFIFDRLYRVDPSRSRPFRQGSGNGLGLAIAKELIEAQKGSIQVESTPGKGTTFTLLLRSAPRSSSKDAMALQ